MIVPLRIAKPRLLAFFALEGCLIFGVLYGLALLTQVVSPELGRGEVEETVAAITGFFLAILIVIQTATLGVQASLIREIVLFSVVAFVTSLVCFVGLWVLLSGLQRLFTLLLLEGAIAVPITVALWRWISVRFAVLNTTRETVLIVGTGEIAQQVCRWICGQHAYEYAVLGFADEDDSRLGSVLAMEVRIQTDFASRRGRLSEEERGATPPDHRRCRNRCPRHLSHRKPVSLDPRPRSDSAHLPAQRATSVR